MNYFAHGRHYFDDPYFLAGTAVPDWLNVVDRRARVRSKAALPMVDDANGQLAAVARGIVRHFKDDDEFHRTRAFAELSWRFTVQVRDAVAPDDGLRPSFLGHILVELLLDAELIRKNPDSVDRYYHSLEQVDADLVQEAVNRMAIRATDRLRGLIEQFVEMRLLSEYLEDDKLHVRLNQIMRRVKLPPLPASFVDILPDCRRQIAARWPELLAWETKRDSGSGVQGSGLRFDDEQSPGD